MRAAMVILLLVGGCVDLFAAGNASVTPRSWQLATIPIIWSVIGASAAFGLGVHADYALPVAAVALAIFSAQRRSGESRGNQPR